MGTKSYCVYIVECADGTLYTGIAKDVKARVHAHNHRKSGARYTSTRRPVKLVYSEKHKNFASAIKKEIKIKGWSRSRKMKLVRSGKKE